ncbi:AAA domain-containing protein [Priestia aryabhattai]|uniref:AAA domain-containing protein n=1 Tax=Priestia aryabhattai TaxID=412384 RepID=UPI002E231615|nr:AAA domain-containing protein [Priestia aryabhattai]
MQTATQNNKPLIELAKYYMEFLENDFKVGTAPKRRIETQHKEHEFLYYGNLKHDIEQLLVKESDSELLVDRHGSFVSLPAEDADYLNNLISRRDMQGIKDKLENVQETKPFFNSERTIKNIEKFLKTYTKNESGINSPLDLLKQNGEIVDLYQYIEQKHEEQKIENGTQFYLYIGSIKHNQKEYPLFFIPLEIEFKERHSFEIELGNTIHIHKKAIEKVHADYRKKHAQTRMLIVKDRKIIRGEKKLGEVDIVQMQLLVDDIADTFGIQRISLFDEEKQVEGNTEIQLSNLFSFALFEKSDETILNDYAEMLDLIEQAGDESLAESFFSMTREYLTGNPEPFEKVIDAAYDNKPLPEKFAFPSPIPLNKEQKQIVTALNTEGCERVVVEGPPGTGKSHTIAGVAYDAIINGKSVLVLSDSMEALDVVEDKITEVLSKVEEENISNPILRLGKKNSNLSEIFNQSNVAKLKMRFKRYSTFLERNTKELKETEQEIQSLIKKEIEIGEKLTPKVMEQTFKYEPIYEEKWSKIIPLEDFSDTDEYEIEYLIATLNTWYKRMQETKVNYIHLKDAWNFRWDKDGENFNHPQLLEQLNEQLQLLKKDVTDEGNLELVADITKPKVKELQLMIEELESAKSPIFGYFLKGSVIKEIQSRFVQTFPSAKLQLKDRLAKVKMELEYYKKKREESSEWEAYGLDIFSLLSTEKINSLLESIKRLKQSVENVHKEDDQYAHIQRALNLAKEDITSCFTNPLGALTEIEFNELITYMQNICTINNNSYQLAEIDINKPVRKYENMLTTKMNYILDQNLLEFLENNRTDAQVIRKQLRQRRKIHKEQFMQLIRAFPCIIVGIRELGEMIPLEPGIFDLVIIDEGSQVSIAQAFPALIRAKKVLVLGDSKQFGNVKSTNASLERNENLFRNVKESFASTMQQSNNVLMEKVKNFDVKNSVLDFATNISNFNTILRKHFRSYYELISYSNKHFYTGSLEVMKIRSKPITEVIRFHEIESEQVKEEKNINRLEAAFILEELAKLREARFKGTVGIITPFRDQQQYISAELLRDKNMAYYEENYRIKIMTFDTCQGEERDVIFYSMVETPNKRNLSSIFPVKELVEDENRRSQRLNVGLSRAKEEVRFVISQSLDAFTGEIGKALRHFESQTHQQDISELYGKTDKKSPMENKLLNLITQTLFYQEYQSNLEIIPQFNMGKFIKQLDPYADVKDYKTDFLIVFHASSGKTKNVILEYDGFEYHFRNRDQVNEWNYDLFYTEEDIERQKTIEMYGYPFIRVNKFIMSKNPIEFLDEHLTKHLSTMAANEEKLNLPTSNDDKEDDDVPYKYCNACGFKKPLIEFYDEKLKTKYGVKCVLCKRKKK